MSTVGKVLCALMALPFLGWMWLASNISEWNRAEGKLLDSTKASLVSASDDVVSTRSDIIRTRANVALVQKEKDSRLTAARALVSQLLRENSSSKETLERFTLQFDTAKLAADASAVRKSKTLELLAQTERELATARTELDQAKDVNAADRGTLDQLRRDLSETLSQNQQLVQSRLQGVVQPETTPPAASTAAGVSAAVTR